MHMRLKKYISVTIDKFFVILSDNFCLNLSAYDVLHFFLKVNSIGM